MKISSVSTLSFQSITPVTSTKEGFDALKDAAKKAGKTNYMLNNPEFMKERASGEKYTSYLITGAEYDKYHKMPYSRRLIQAGIYDQNRAPVEITSKSKTLIEKLIKRI